MFYEETYEKIIIIHIYYDSKFLLLTLLSTKTFKKFVYQTQILYNKI